MSSVYSLKPRSSSVRSSPPMSTVLAADDVDRGAA